MNSRFDAFESELTSIQEDMRSNGVNPTNEARLKRLVSDIKFVIALGPSESIPRDRLDSNVPDSLDINYFKKVTSVNSTNDIFDDDDWGKASVVLEQREFNGANVPSLVVRWDNYYQFFLDQGNNREYTDKKLNGYCSAIALMLALKWHAGRVELV